MSIEVKCETRTGPNAGAELDQEIGEELDKFDMYFRSLGNEPLSRPEASIIKTFLVYKLVHEKR